MKNNLTPFLKEFELLDQTPPKLCDSLIETQLDVKHLTFIVQKLYSLIDSEMEVYGCTLTLKNKFRDDDDVYIHRYIDNKIKSSRVWKDVKYILLSEFSPDGKLHYHGIIYGCYQFSFLRCVKWWRRIFGFVKPEINIKNRTNWFKYILKDYKKSGLWTIYKIK